MGQRYPQEMKVRNLVWGNGEHLAAVKEEFGEIDFLLGSSVCYDEDSSIPLLETIMALSTPAEFEDCSSVEASAEATQGSEDVPTHFEPRVLKRGTITILVLEDRDLDLFNFLKYAQEYVQSGRLTMKLVDIAAAFETNASANISSSATLKILSFFGEDVEDVETLEVDSNAGFKILPLHLRSYSSMSGGDR